MAVTVGSDNTRVEDAEATTGWTNIGGGGGIATEPDIVYSGTFAASRKISTSLIGRGYDYTSDGGGSVDMTAAGNHWIAKVTATNPAALLTRTSPALHVRVGSSSSDYKDFYVAGSDNYPAKGGWLLVPIDPTVAGYQDATSGTAAFASTDYFGVLSDFSAGSKSENVAIDAIDVGNGLFIHGNTPDAEWSDLVSHDQGTQANRFGYVTQTDTIISVLGRIAIGQDGTPTATVTDFTDEGQVIVWGNGYASTGFHEMLINLGAASTINQTLCTFISTGELNNTVGGLGYTTTEDTRTNLTVSGTTGTATFDGCVFKNFSDVTLTTATTMDACDISCATFDDGGGAEIFDGTIRTTSLANVATYTDPEFGSTTNLRDTAFVQEGAGHAIEITTATERTFNGLTFTGYNAADENSDSALFINLASGAITINIVGGNTPSYRRPGGSTATVTFVENPVTATVTVTTTAGVAIQNARVLLEASSGTGDLPYLDAVTMSGSGTVMTVTHTAHGIDNGKKVHIRGSATEEVNGVKTITVTGANTYTYSSTTSGTPSGSHTSTGVVLEGLTDVNGEISDTRSYSVNQPVTGRSRKGSVAPYYKTAAINGTINASSGFDVSVPMVFDGGVLVATVPDAPANVVATVQDASADLVWSIPFNGGSPITDYLIDYRTTVPGSWTLFSDGTSTAASATVTGLTNGTEYEFRVAAVNAEGTSDESDTSNAITAGTTNEPTGLSADPGDTEVNLSWTAPSDTNGSAITDYRVEYKPAAGSWTLFVDGTSTATSTTVTSLTNDTSYEFRVAAINARGTGPWSTTDSATPVASSGASVGAIGSLGTVDAGTNLALTIPAAGGTTTSIYVALIFSEITGATIATLPAGWHQYAVEESTGSSVDHTMFICWCRGTTASTNDPGDSVTFGMTTSDRYSGYIIELTDANTASPFSQKVEANTSTETTSVTSGSMTVGGDLVVVYGGQQLAVSETPNFVTSSSPTATWTQHIDSLVSNGYHGHSFASAEPASGSTTFTITSDQTDYWALMAAEVNSSAFTGTVEISTDTFTQGDGAPTGWTTQVDTAETILVASNVLEFSGSQLLATNDTVLSESNHQWAELKIDGWSSATNWREFGVAVRLLDAATDRTGYFLYASPATNTGTNNFRVQINRSSTTGARASIGSYVTGLGDLRGSTIAIEVEGNTLRGYVDGTLLLTETDTNYSSAATRESAGIWGYNIDDTTTVDNFRAGTGQYPGPA